MKKKRYLFYSSLLSSLFILNSCHKDFEFTNNQVPEGYSQEVLGFTTDPNHTWCTTESGVFDVNIPSGYIKAQAVVCNLDDEGELFLRVLTETSKNGRLYYDTPIDNEGIFLVYVSSDGFYKFSEDTRGTTRSSKRSIGEDIVLPPESGLVLSGCKDAYSKIRGWNSDVLYYSDIDCGGIIEVEDYPEEVAKTLKMIIFSYFKNGKQYDNLSLVKKSGCYNENSYPITTGEDPIIISPIYKSDGTSREVENAELYYYYFPASSESTIDISSLPKYRAITLRNSIKENGVLSKFHSYALVYWGDNDPEVGITGTFNFPKGYKIGFMLRSNVPDYNGQKQGELYCDGRLNGKINKYGHFKSSKMSETDPRMAWLKVNGRYLLCCESGSDRDINDLILEVAGAEVPEVIPDIDLNHYTFCFEDSRLGDYDLNDVVIGARRLDESHIEYTLMACGAHDNLYIGGIEGKRITSTKEVHDIFGRPRSTFINTESISIPFVIDTVEVNKEFSFLDSETQPYIINSSKGYNVYISRKGEDPHAIMIPSDFSWSKERVCIKDSYLQFGNWGKNMVESTDWYLYPQEEKVIK